MGPVIPARRVEPHARLGAADRDNPAQRLVRLIAPELGILNDSRHRTFPLPIQINGLASPVCTGRVRMRFHSIG
jgi:hypothetical protein